MQKPYKKAYCDPKSFEIYVFSFQIFQNFYEMVEILNSPFLKYNL